MKNTLSVGTAALAVILFSQSASAQDGYFFGAPKFTVGLHAGASQPDARDEIFNFMTSELTLAKKDFASPTFGADIAYQIHPHVDVQLSVSGAHSSKRSEFREWEDENNLPIEQVTKLSTVPVMAGLKLYLLPRGRSLGQYAWVPKTLSPYVGAAGGVTWYRLEQEGEFVDHETLDIFADHFISDGAAATLHVYGGTEVWLMSRVALNAEARYAWGSASLNNSFEDFEKIDLRGLQLTTGLSVRF